jgi:hypothetical protein
MVENKKTTEAVRQEMEKMSKNQSTAQQGVEGSQKKRAVPLNPQLTKEEVQQRAQHGQPGIHGQR